MLEKVTLHIDGHVHIYPHYDLAGTLQNGLNHLNSLKGKHGSKHIVPILLLTERSDCHFFEEARKSNVEFEDGHGRLKLVPKDEKETIVLETDGKPVLYILAGRQIVVKEGLEVLALATTLFMDDRKKTIDEAIKIINDSNGILALNWAPGKWFFSRGKVVKRILEEYRPEDLILCDTSLRNVFWPLPKLMRIAQKRGFKVIAGSDPLPFKGEEKYVGSYGFCLTGAFDPDKPAHSLRSLMKKNGINISSIGKRNGFFPFLKRESRIMLEKKKGR